MMGSSYTETLMINATRSATNTHEVPLIMHITYHILQL